MAISNKDVEVLSEALFCYYFAIYKKKKDKDYSVSDWDDITKVKDIATFTNKYGITSMVSNVNSDPAFRSRVCKVCLLYTSDAADDLL